MTPPRLIHLGQSRTPLLVIDDFTGALPTITNIAADLAPYPTARGSSYPGLRRLITPADGAAADYARQALRALVPHVNAAFGVDGFDLLEASFSMVTTPPDALAPPQRRPHFDAVDPNHLAILHYLSDGAGGTAFFRQRSTGIERVTAGCVEEFVTTAARECGAAQGYVTGSNSWFERIGATDARADRLIVYPGSLLHSGVIPADLQLSDDPRRGRLTANFFVRGRTADKGSYHDGS